MDLKKRLARLDRGHRPPASERTPTARRAEEFGLAEDTTRAGVVWRRRRMADLPPPALPDLTGFLARHVGAAAAAHDLLFLDTETTGLAGGTGTVPFLVGLAWWEDGTFVVEQLFLPGPAHEPALLAALDHATAGRRVVVTYNGASFDLPLLRTRALLQRTTSPLDGLAHWDLLVPARRVWSRRLPDCRQQTVEEEVTGYARGAGDIGGGRIPQVWFDFLADGRGDLLPAVLRHNRRDMEGMARILAAVCGIAAVLDDPAACTDWRDAWARARICAARRDLEPAAAHVARATALGADWSVRAFAADAVRILKRARLWDAQRNVLERCLAAGLDEDWLHVEAAILHEHRLRDLEKALAHARAADDDHRVTRLTRRLAGRNRSEEQS